MMTKTSRLLIGILCAVGLAFSPISATAADRCGIYNSRNWPDGVPFEQSTCGPTQWTEHTFNDGFESGILIYMENDYPDMEEGYWELSNSAEYINRSLWITCSNRKLQIRVDAEYPDSYGYTGQGLVKFDSGKPKTFSYQVGSPFDDAFINNTSSFLSSLKSAKKSVSFSIGTLMGTEITTFPVGNLASFQQKFKNAGCSLGSFPKPKPLEIPLRVESDPLAYCFVDAISDQAIDAYGISKINWTVTSTIGKKKPVLLDKFSVDVLKASQIQPKIEPQKKGLAITMPQVDNPAGNIIYTYTPEVHRKGEKFTCSTTVTAKSGTWAKQSKSVVVVTPRSGYAQE
jgi:hypothetical protein